MSPTATAKTGKRAMWSLCVFAALLVLCIAWVLYGLVRPTNARDNTDSGKQREMLAIVLKVGELAPLPKGAAVKTATEGNMFTRSFRMSFKADAGVIADWLTRSKGVRTAKIVNLGSITQYVLDAKCGYQYAEVNVDSRKGNVTACVSKS